MGKCQCMTVKHKQCSRDVKGSSQYCFQHQSCKVPIQKSEPDQKPKSPPKSQPKSSSIKTMPVYQKLLKHFDAKMINKLSEQHLHELEDVIKSIKMLQIDDKEKFIIFNSVQGLKRINNEFPNDKHLKNLLQLYSPVNFVFLSHYNPNTVKLTRFITLSDFSTFMLII
jgi:hypothetical protein